MVNMTTFAQGLVEIHLLRIYGLCHIYAGNQVICLVPLVGSLGYLGS